MQRLASRTMSAGFRATSLRPGVAPMGHVLNVDHFHMSQPTFPPHPHAGFSAVTWMMPWSPGGFTNRDSRGDASRITPGTLHWTLAGSGVIHEEIPEVPGVDCEGLQIFVKLPEADELTPPRAFHLEPPTADLGAATARVLVGEVGGVRSPVVDASGTTLVHVSVRGPEVLDVPSEGFALVLRGAGTLAGVAVQVHDAGPVAAGPLALAGDGLEVLVGWSPPMPRQPTFRGPFCLFDPARLADAERRYRAGELGRLAPSPAFGAR